MRKKGVSALVLYRKISGGVKGDVVAGFAMGGDVRVAEEVVATQ